MVRLFLLALLFAAPIAQGADLPSIGVVGLHQGSLTTDQQKRASAAIAQAISDTDFFTAESPGQVATRLQGRERIILQDAFLGPGRSLLEEGSILYNQAQTEDAVPVLEEAAETLRNGMANAHSTKDLWDAYVYLGAARLALMDGKEAKISFAKAVALNPLRSPDSARFPPDIIERYDTQRRELQALASTVTVDADEEGTLIYVNGVEKGVVPCVVEDVVPGENFIGARSPSGWQSFEVIEVPEAGTKKVSLRLGEPTLGTAARSKFARSRQMTSLYKALGEHAGVDLILLGGISEGKLVIQLFNPRTDGFSTTVEVPYSDTADDEAVAAVADLLTGVKDDGTFEAEHRAPLAAPLDIGTNKLLARMLVLPDSVATPLGPADPKGKGVPKWVVYSTVGVLGAGAVAGGAYGLSWALTEPNQGTIVVGPIP